MAANFRTFMYRRRMGSWCRAVGPRRPFSVMAALILSMMAGISPSAMSAASLDLM
jgi:hypothetical protein